MHPLLIVGAALVGLPVVLHLIMKQEPKRLPFPAFRFLKQRLKTNQRKLRLRHFILLALRMLLIALFCLTLYQPSILSQGLIDLHGTQPVAVVVVIDTSPGMGYAGGTETNLEVACRRATELVNDLPDGSRVAVVETGDPGGDWLPSAADARARLQEIAARAPKPNKPATAAGTGQPVTSALVHAYGLLRTVDEQTDAADALPRLVAVFTDRAASSWDPSRLDELKKLRDAVPDPKPAHAVVDVGTDQPVNVAILSAEMTDGRPQVVPANQPVSVTVTLAAVGLDAKATVNARLDDGADLPKEVAVPDGQTRQVAFEFKDLKPGPHQLRFKLGTDDALAADNERFLTFQVAGARTVLTLSDDPDDARLWKLAIDLKGEFACVVKSPADATDADLAGADAVALLNVARPDDALWNRLRAYVEGGGKLIVIPGGDDRLSLEAYTGEAAAKLLPGVFKKVVDTTAAPDPKDAKAKDRRAGAVWSVFADDDSRELAHPMLGPVREWKQRKDVDVDRNPRRAQKYWEAEPRGGGRVVATYDTAADPAQRHPAVLERDFADPKDKARTGKVLMLTTRMDPDNGWNDYWELTNSSWPVVFPAMLLRYAAGSAADANFNHPTGTTVAVPLAKLVAGPRPNLVLAGPGISGAEGRVTVADRQTELRVGPPRTNLPGNFTLTAFEDAPGPPKVRGREGFSTNVPAEESTFDKVPAEGVEELTGKNTVVPVGKALDLKEALLSGTDTFKHPLDLFPWLLIAVLMLLVVEGLVANKFYRRAK